MLTIGEKIKLRRISLAAIMLLYIVAIPWHFLPWASSTVVLGLPLWVLVALSLYLLVAILSAISWYCTPIAEHEEDKA